MSAFTISSILIAITNIFLGFFILWRSEDKHIKYIWSIFCFLVAMWGIGGYKISTVTSEEEASFWWQIAIIGPIFVPVLYYHFIFAFLQLKKKIYKYILAVSYVLAFCFLAVNIFFPENFVGDLKFIFNHIWIAKSYTPIYLFLYIIFYCIFLSYSFFLLIIAYGNSKGIMRNQLKYFIAASIFGWLGPHGVYLLVFNILIYPYSNFFTAIYPIVFTYAILRYQLMDINIIIRKTFFYSIIVALISGFITAISFLNSWLVDNIPGFKLWVAPLLMGAVTFIIGRLFWNKTKEVEKLKYEFITVAAHKLRTPLTEIKWAAEALKDKPLKENDKYKLIKAIVSADEYLIELTNELLDITKTDAMVYNYKFESVNFEEMVKEVIKKFDLQLKEKNIKVNMHFERDLPKVMADRIRIGLVVERLLENAVLYTKNKIDISVDIYKKNLIFHIEDNGIGIIKADQKFIFSKFYRGHNARLAETEGSGVNLYLTKKIIEKHGGKIGVRSEGEGKGSIFWFSLPIIN